MNNEDHVEPPDPDSEDEAIGLESGEEAEEDGGPTSNSEGEEDEPDGGIIARRFLCLCAGCDNVMSIGTLATRNGSFLFHTLLLAEKLTLICNSCLADIGLLPDDGE